MRHSKSRKLVRVVNSICNSHCIACPLPLGCKHLDTCTCLMLFCLCILLQQKKHGHVKGGLVCCCHFGNAMQVASDEASAPSSFLFIRSWKWISLSIPCITCNPQTELALGRQTRAIPRKTAIT